MVAMIVSLLSVKILIAVSSLLVNNKYSSTAVGKDEECKAQSGWGRSHNICSP